MDRLQSEPFGRRGYNADRNEDGSPCDIEEPLHCGSCGAKVPELFPCSWDADLTVGRCCLIHPDEEAEFGNLCEQAKDIAAECLTAEQFTAALRVHVAECVVCGCNRGDVVYDPLALAQPEAVCCGEAA